MSVPRSPLPFREIKRRLEAIGFVEVSQKGSHVKFVRTIGTETRTAIVPHHREVSIGTLASILRQAGLTADEFDRL